MRSNIAINNYTIIKDSDKFRSEKINALLFSEIF